MEIPKNAKVSHFFTSPFLDSVLIYLLVVSGNKDKEEIYEVSSDFSLMIQECTRSPVEKFLDRVAIEFNKCYYTDGVKESSDDESPGTVTIPQIEVLNYFLTRIHISELSAWQQIESTQQTTKRDFDVRSDFQNEQNILSGIYNSFIDNDGYNTINTNRYKKKQFSQKIGLLDTRIANKLSDMEFEDVLNTLDQLYYFFSIILCIGILGRRSSWGITQLNYLNNGSKIWLLKWCEVEANMKPIINDEGSIENDSILISSSNINSVMNGEGWMNILETGEGEKNDGNINIVGNFDSTDEENLQLVNNLVKKCEKLIVKNEEIELKNSKLLTENNELKFEMDKLNREIDQIKNGIPASVDGSNISETVIDNESELIRNELGLISIGSSHQSNILFDEIVEKAKHSVRTECDAMYSRIIAKRNEMFERKIYRLQGDIEEYKEKIKLFKEDNDELHRRYDLLEEEKELCCEYYKLSSMFYLSSYQIERNQKIWDLNEKDYIEIKNVDMYELNRMLIKEELRYGEIISLLGEFLEKYRVNMLIMMKVIFDLKELSSIHYESGQSNSEYWSQLISMSVSIQNLRVTIKEMKFEENKGIDNFLNCCMNQVIDSISWVLEFKEEDIMKIMEECRLEKESIQFKDYGDLRDIVGLEEFVDVVDLNLKND